MITIKPLAGALGAELYGIDLTTDISSEVYAEIRRLFVEHEVIFFRDQDVNHAQQKALAQSFGPLQTHPSYGSIAGFPEISILESTAENPTKIELWHSDMSFKPNPALATLLRSRILPQKGGDTIWSSMTAAYHGLSQGMQIMLEGLTAMHDYRHGFQHSIEEASGSKRFIEAVRNNPPVEHPVIRVHPESGKKVIFVNELLTSHIVGVPKAESDAILQFLYQHIAQVEYTCRFSWGPNCLALWDNRSTQHKPVNDYFPAHRMLERITIDDDKTYY